MKRHTVLLVGGDQSLRRCWNSRLIGRGFEVMEASGKNGLISSFQDTHTDLVVAVSCMRGGQEGLDVARRIRTRDRSVPVVLIASHGSEAVAIAAIRAGVNDYLKASFSEKELMASVDRVLSGQTVVPNVQTHNPMTGVMTGVSAAMREVKAQLSRIAATESTVLITGETGTGKELAAEYIHRNSPRRGKPFICTDCAAFPDTSLENESFGYKRGAFTGAFSSYACKLKLADMGTVFLDEIGEMNRHAQAKILRAIESKRFFRLGGRTSTSADVRFIAATNQDLDQLMKEGGFREVFTTRLMLPGFTCRHHMTGRRIFLLCWSTTYGG